MQYLKRKSILKSLCMVAMLGLYGFSWAQASDVNATDAIVSLNDEVNEIRVKALPQTTLKPEHQPQDAAYKDLIEDIEQLAQKSNSDYQADKNKAKNKTNPELAQSTNLTLGHFFAVAPVRNAKVTSHFGFRSLGGVARPHLGIDFGAPTGTPIYATGDGMVSFSGWKNGFGNVVEITHSNGYLTRYAHASALFVSVGERVGKGEKIAAVGSTGRSTGPHLHFEIVKNGKHQDPGVYLAMLKN